MKKTIMALAAAATLAYSGLALAHGAKPAQYGGTVQTSGDLQFELVNKNGVPTIYVDDHDAKFSVAGISGKLTVLTGTQKAETALAAGPDNALVAADKVALASGAKAVAVIKFADGKSMSVRFTVK